MKVQWRITGATALAAIFASALLVPPALGQSDLSLSPKPSHAPAPEATQPAAAAPYAKDLGKILKPASAGLKLLQLMNHGRLAANQRKAKRAVLPLQWDPQLAQAALAHSRDMAVNHYFGHVGPRGDSPCDRLAQAGVRWQTMGENIARNFTAMEAEEAFMSEPNAKSNHRSNILNPNFNYAGVGIVRGEDGMIYVTQEFAKEP